MASTYPSPRTLRVERSAVTLVEAAIVRSWSFGLYARSWMSDPPGWSVNTPFRIGPARFSVNWLVAPRIWLATWHSPQPRALKMGPTPSASASGPVNSSMAVARLHSASGMSGELGESVKRLWFAQNSRAKPLSSLSKPVTASWGPDCVCAGSLPPTKNIDGTAHTASSDRTLNRVIRITRILSVVTTALRTLTPRRSRDLAENRPCRAPRSARRTPVEMLFGAWRGPIHCGPSAEDSLNFGGPSTDGTSSHASWRGGSGAQPSIRGRPA